MKYTSKYSPEEWTDNCLDPEPIMPWENLPKSSLFEPNYRDLK